MAPGVGQNVQLLHNPYNQPLSENIRSLSIDGAAIRQISTANSTSAAFSGVRPRSWQLNRLPISPLENADMPPQPCSTSRLSGQHPRSTCDVLRGSMIPATTYATAQSNARSSVVPNHHALNMLGSLRPQQIDPHTQLPRSLVSQRAQPPLPSPSPSNSADSPSTDQFHPLANKRVPSSAGVDHNGLGRLPSHNASTSLTPTTSGLLSSNAEILYPTGASSSNNSGLYAVPRYQCLPGQTPVSPSGYGITSGHPGSRQFAAQSTSVRASPITLDLISPEASTSPSPVNEPVTLPGSSHEPTLPQTLRWPVEQVGGFGCFRSAATDRRPRTSNTLPTPRSITQPSVQPHQQADSAGTAYPGPSGMSLDFVGLIRRLHAFASRQTQKRVFRELEYHRLCLVDNALKKHDDVFLALHQLCSLAPWPDSPFLAGARDANHTEGCRLLLLMMVGNDQLHPETGQFFGSFPVPLEYALTHYPAFALKLYRAREFLGYFPQLHHGLRFQCQLRGYPPLVDEFLDQLHMPSEILQELTFRSIRRNMFPSQQEDANTRALDEIFKSSQLELAKIRNSGRPAPAQAVVLQALRDVVVGRYRHCVNAIIDPTSRASMSSADQGCRNQARRESTQLQIHPPTHVPQGTPLPSHGMASQAGYTGHHANGQMSQAQAYHQMLARTSHHQSSDRSVSRPMGPSHVLRRGSQGNMQITNPALPRPTAPSTATPTHANGYPRQLPAKMTKPKLLFPPIGAPITQIRQPGYLSALHQTPLRSPVLAPADPATAAAERLHRCVVGLVEEPWLVAVPRSANVNKSFTVPSLESRARTAKSPTRGAPQLRYVREGSSLYRIRCVKVSEKERWSLSYDAFISKPISWPPTLSIRLNDQALGIRRKTQHSRDLPVDITSFLNEGSNRIDIYYVSKAKQIPESERRFFYAFGIEILTVLSTPSILDLASTNAYPAADTLKQLIVHLSPTAPTSQSDDLAVVPPDSLTLSIRDPLSAKIIKLPVRSRACAHRECFDLETFISSRRPLEPPSGGEQSWEKRPSSAEHWKCPICNADTRPALLGIDEWLKGVVEEVARKAEERRRGSRAKSWRGGEGMADVEMEDGENDDADGPDEVEAVVIKADGSWTEKMFDVMGGAGNGQIGGTRRSKEQKSGTPDTGGIDAMNLDSPVDGMVGNGTLNGPAPVHEKRNGPVVIDLLDDD